MYVLCINMLNMLYKNDIINLNIYPFYLLFNISSILMKLPYK